MSAISVQPDPFDARRVRSVDGLVREFNDAGVLASADVHVAARLAAIAGERHDSVMLAAALAVRAPRLGHVHVDLASIRDTAAVDTEEPVDLSALPWPDVEEWIERVAASELGGRRRSGRRRRASAEARRHLAVPRPLLGRGARSRRRAAGDERRIRARRLGGRARRRDRASVRRRSRSPPGHGCG